MSIALELRDLVKQYPKGIAALKGISLQVAEGDFFALLGPNGAGKSTTIGIVSSLVNKTSGDVFVFGYDLGRETTKAKSMIGLVPQEFNFSIFETVLDIVVNQAGFYGLPRKRALERAEYYLRKLQLWEKRKAQARTLSGGMKRRLMIARGMVHDPKLLILDEPTAGVDIEIRRSMWVFLKELNEAGVTIILTTHYLEEAESLCRTIAIIDQGRIIENTTKKELMKKLHRETVIFDLNAPLLELPEVEGYQLHLIDETTLEVTYPKDLMLNTFFCEFAKLGVGVLSMRNKSNRLEELFLGLVSKENGVQSI